jgi:hypothetical protein
MVVVVSALKCKGCATRALPRVTACSPPRGTISRSTYALTGPLPGRRARRDRNSSGRAAATRRHLRPRVTGGRAYSAADCRPHTTGLTGAGKAGCPGTLPPGRDPAAPRGRAGRSRCPDRCAPRAADFFYAAARVSCCLSFQYGYSVASLTRSLCASRTLLSPRRPASVRPNAV